MRRALGYGLFSDNYAQGNRPHSSQIIEKIAQDTNFHAERFAANLHHNVIYIILPILHPHRGVSFPATKDFADPETRIDSTSCPNTNKKPRLLRGRGFCFKLSNCCYRQLGQYLCKFVVQYFELV